MSTLLDTFRIDFMRHALLAGSLAAAMCAYLGVYVVLRRMVFVGVALAEMSSAGVALALLLGVAPMLGALGLMLVGVALFSVRWTARKVPQDTFIGIGYAVAAALGILLIAKSAKGEAHMLELLYGNVLTAAPGETLQMLTVFAGVAVLHVLFGKEFLLASFDPDWGETIGVRVRLWNVLLYLTIGLAIAFSIRAMGVLLTFAMLTLPAAGALVVTGRMRQALWVSPLLAILPIALGLHISLVGDLPPAAAAVMLSFLLLVACAAGERLRRRA